MRCYVGEQGKVSYFIRAPIGKIGFSCFVLPFSLINHIFFCSPAGRPHKMLTQLSAKRE